ncbi:hypothetical protein J6590_015003 [Homalodisca vitripennis]|nr:hypothetical protein J6590_015003 [Homalodisca vitripennis]
MLPSGSSTELCLASSASVAPPCAGSWSSSLRCVEYERVLFVCEPGNWCFKTVVMPKFEKKPEGEGRGEWSEDAMKLAVAVVLEIQISERAASKRYNVPRSTLQRKIKAISNNQEIVLKRKKKRQDKQENKSDLRNRELQKCCHNPKKGENNKIC